MIALPEKAIAPTLASIRPRRLAAAEMCEVGAGVFMRRVFYGTPASIYGKRRQRRKFVVGFGTMRPRSLPVVEWLLTFAAVFTVGALGFGLPSLGAHLTLPLL